MAVLRLVVALAAALALFGFGANFLTEYHAYQDRGVVVTGRVIDYDEGAYRQPEAVKVDFVVGGERLQLWTDKYEGSLRMGDEVDLLVDLEQPTRFQAVDWGVSLVETILLWIGAGLALAVAVFTAVQMWLMPRQEQLPDPGLPSVVAGVGPGRGQQAPAAVAEEPEHVSQGRAEGQWLHGFLHDDDKPSWPFVFGSPPVAAGLPMTAFVGSILWVGLMFDVLSNHPVLAAALSVPLVVASLLWVGINYAYLTYSFVRDLLRGG